MKALQKAINTAPATFAETAQGLAAIDFKNMVENATPKQLEAMAKLYMAQQAQATFTAAVKIAGIDYNAEKQIFLENAGRTKSKHTARSYKNGLKTLETYAEEKRLNVLELNPTTADGFIYWKNQKGSSAATVRLAVAAASSFFTFLERRFPETIKNVFRGTKARPQYHYIYIDLPTDKEIKELISALPKKWGAAVYIMAGRGLRVGALSGLSIKGLRFTTRTKGQDKSGDLDEKIVMAIKDAGLELRQPFGDMTDEQLQHAITYEIGKVYKAGKIRFPFSPHKLRHYYAVAEYRRNKDIRRLSKLLGHSGIAITERYLRGLGEVD